MTTETINLPEISCQHCQVSIEGALRPLSGVSAATVDVEGKTVTVTYDERQVRRRALLEAIEAQGYTVP